MISGLLCLMIRDSSIASRISRYGAFCLLLAAAGLSLRLYIVSATDQYFAGDGSALSSAKWGSDPAGPFTSLFIAGNLANFSIPNGTAAGGSINVAGINASENLTVTSASGTISNLNNGVVPVT